MKKYEDYDVLVDYSLAEKLYRLGFQVGTEQCIARYESDFVYDGDPEHPESHKAGDIRIYDFYHKNNKDEKSLLECPTVEMLAVWLLEKYNIHVAPDPHLMPDGSWQWSYIVMSYPHMELEAKDDAFFDSRAKAWLMGADAVVDELLKKMDEKDVRSEQYL